jgi:predicted Zn-dependent protease
METPEEFAGVMAHEMQHVLHKHGTRAVARQVSGATLLSLLVGGGAATPAAVEGAAGLINLHYQRADEDAADRGSVPLLAKAGISPHGLPAFLRRLRLHPSFREAPSKYLSTHPAMVERTARLEAEVGRIPKPPALLSTEEWVAARKVCRP